MKRLHRAASLAIAGCLLSCPIPLFLSEASPPPLRVTLTHFTLSSYERALRLLASFPISGLARLGVKPRLCRSSWRAFASTHPLMLFSTCSREALLACPLFPSWNLPSFTVGSTLSTPCSRSDPPLPRQGATLIHLDSLPTHDLVLWTEGSVPFPFGKCGFGVLANCSLCDTETTLSFSAGSVCSSFSAEACAILHALCGSRQHQQVCHFSSLHLVLSSPLGPLLRLLPETLWQMKQELSSLSSCSFRLQWDPDTRFSRVTTRLMSWPDGERYLRPPLSLVVSLLLSLVSTLVFSRTGGVLSHRNSLIHKFPRYPPWNLCSLLLLFARPLSMDGGMADDHGAPEAGQLPTVWTRGRTETENRQRVSGVKIP